MDHPIEHNGPCSEPPEVVLRYEAHAAPIVERYVQPTPLPGKKEPIAPPPRRRKIAQPGPPVKGNPPIYGGAMHP